MKKFWKFFFSISVKLWRKMKKSFKNFEEKYENMNKNFVTF